MSAPTGMLAVAPSTLGVGEEFTLKLKLLGPVYPVPCRGNFCDPKPALGGPYNLNVQRQIQYHDNVLPEFVGRVLVDGGPDLEGPSEIVFDGENQGVYRSSGDRRPIRQVGGFRWRGPGIQFIRLIEPESGLEAWVNPCRVTAKAPAERLYWGDPHWQTFMSDGIRIPEELYAFARDEGFLDFGAVSDHMEAVTDRQWDYFQAVTNDFNEPGRFATLQGQEWTHHAKDRGAPGHRNIYYRGDGGPAIRSNGADADTLEKLWARLDELSAEGYEVLAIPHHPANLVMGIRWELGWNPRYETCVEIYSVWGNSEKPASAGNPIPIRSCQGEMAGRHVIEALKMGFRMGFMGGGDIHDGRPGDSMHNESYPARGWTIPRQGLTCVRVPELTREAVFDAMREKRTYATTLSRILLEVTPSASPDGLSLAIEAASEDGIANLVVVRQGEETLLPVGERVARRTAVVEGLAPDEFCYVRVETSGGEMAWSTPVWGDDV